MKKIGKAAALGLSIWFAALFMSACFPLLPQKSVERIAVTTPPAKTEYTAGQNFLKAGMEVTAYYDNGSEAVVSDYEYSPKSALKISDTVITISYSGEETTQAITVMPVQKILTDVKITKMPDKRTYIVGEVFNPAGMMVTAEYDNGDKSEISDYEYSPKTALKLTDNVITVLYNGQEITQAITVTTAEKAVVRIEVTRQPGKLSYMVGESFSRYEMVVTAEYANGEKEAVAGYTVEPNGALKTSDTFVTVFYGGKDTTVAITVSSNHVSMDFDASGCSFYDKFDGNTLDLTKWAFHEGDGSNYGIPGWGNNEEQYYQRENVTVADGKMSLTAKMEEKDGKYYTSAKLVTFDKYSDKKTFAQTYGRFEARIRLTKAEQGMWPAFWMMPADDVYGGWAKSGEIDIMEMKGRFPSKASSALHFADGWPFNRYVAHEYEFADGGSITDWHIYGVDWEPDRITFTVDGVPHKTWTHNEWYTNGASTNEFAPFDQDFYICLNLAVGGEFDGYRVPDDDEMPIALEFDFVRVWAYGSGYGA